MMRSAILLSLCSVCVLGQARVSSADFSTAKNTAIVSPAGTTLSGTMSATIEKGKKKNILLIQTTLQAATQDPSEVCVNAVRANTFNATKGGVSSLGVVCTHCTAGGCTLTTTHWLDIDAAEVAHPGAFVNQPITIELDYSGTGSGGMFPIMVVQMQKP
jgi:hypothetical protein